MIYAASVTALILGFWARGWFHNLAARKGLTDDRTLKRVLDRLTFTQLQHVREAVIAELDRRGKA